MMRACLVTVSGVAAPRSISHGSLPWDATASYGRWQLAGTARKYISQAVADLEEVRLCESGSTRASRLARIFQPLIAFKLQQYSAEDKRNIIF